MVEYLYSIIHAYKIFIFNQLRDQWSYTLYTYELNWKGINLLTFCFFKFLSFHLSLLFGDFRGNPQGPSHKSTCSHRSGLRAGLVRLKKLCNVHTATGHILSHIYLHVLQVSLWQNHKKYVMYSLRRGNYHWFNILQHTSKSQEFKCQ